MNSIIYKQKMYSEKKHISNETLLRMIYYYKKESYWLENYFWLNEYKFL